MIKQFFERNSRAVIVWSIMGLILVVAAAFRFNRLDWDDGQHFHPDERAIIWAPGAQGVMNLMTVPATGAYDDGSAPRKAVDFPPGGLGFFIPNDKSNLRSATKSETEAFNAAKAVGQTYKLPPNVVAPDQPVPPDAINFWNASFSPLNPRFFAYGSLPMYLIKFGGYVATLVSGEAKWHQYDGYFLVGRWISALFSMLTVAVAFGIGRRAFRTLGHNLADAIGLTAAAFLAVTVLDIQLAHFLTTDVSMSFFIALTLYFALGLTQTGSRWQAVGVGASFALAMACKVSAAPLIVPIFIAALLFGLIGKEDNLRFTIYDLRLKKRVSGDRFQVSGDGELTTQNSKLMRPSYEGKTQNSSDSSFILHPSSLISRLLSRSLGNLVIIGLVALVVFFVVMPYGLLDWTTWTDRLLLENRISRGEDIVPYTQQYVGTAPVLFQLGNLVQWGLSIPLGLLALAGLIYSLWQGGRVRLKTELVLLAFVLAYALATMTSETKFDRYLLPYTPILAVLAARLLVTLYAKAAGDLRFTIYDLRLGKRRSADEGLITQNSKFKTQNFIVPVIGLFVFGWAAIWAVSFSSIYDQPHSRVAASDWIYKNVPAGAKLSAEAWDENAPFDLPAQSKFSGVYQKVAWNSYQTGPNEQMADYWARLLNDTDYIVLSSNRLYATIPKLPWRYPVTTHLYDLLFSGQLGFEKVYEATSYPTVPLFGWQINDDTADESFTVYDHPKVLIFKKKENLTLEQWRGLFKPALTAPFIDKRQVSASELPKYDPKEAEKTYNQVQANLLTDANGKTINTIELLESQSFVGGILRSTAQSLRQNIGKSLMLDKPVDFQPVVNDNGWNGFGSDNHWFAAICWFALIQVLGLIGLPVMIRAARRLPDQGYIMAKPVGAAIVALIIWLVVSTRFYMNTVATAYMCLLLGAAGSALLWWRWWPDIKAFWQNKKRLILIEEIVFLIGFLVFLGIRWGNPDLWHPAFGGEKPMEFAHINAILKSAYFPPYDPWFSDGYINYYYFGQYIVSTWIKLTGIIPAVSFNLAIPVLYGFVLGGGFSLSYNLAAGYKRTQAIRAGLPMEQVDKLKQRGPLLAAAFGAFLLAVAANIDGVIQVMQRADWFAKWLNDSKLYPVTAARLEGYDYFRSSRVIQNTINEFPFFSFLYADLHAHLIALPFTLVLIALALNLVSVSWVNYSERGQNFIRRWAGRLWHIFDKSLVIPLVLALIIGLVGATNIWDLPTYTLVVAAALFIGLARKPIIKAVTERHELAGMSPRFQPLTLLVNLLLAGAASGVILLTGYTLYSNFFGNYQALYSSIQTTTYHSPPLQFAFIFLMPLFLIFSYLVWGWWRWLNPRPVEAYDPDGDYDNDGFADEIDEPQAVRQPVTTTVRMSVFRPKVRRPELALLSVGADGGSGGYDVGGSEFIPETPRRRWQINGYALIWLIAVGFAGLLVLWDWFIAGDGLATINPYDYPVQVTGLWNTWSWIFSKQGALFATLLFLVIGLFGLTFGRAFDRDRQHSSEARTPQVVFVGLLAIAACCIAAGTEMIILADDFAGSYLERMNTVFKFFYQVWTLFAIAGGFFAYVLWTNWIAPNLNFQKNRERVNSRKRMAGRYVWVGALTILSFSVGLYCILVTPGRIQEREEDPLPPLSLNGLNYFDTLKFAGGVPEMPRNAGFDLTYDARSLREFYSKLTGTPVILQASVHPYRGGGSWIGSDTGLPLVLGYDHHEEQQRYPYLIPQRSRYNGFFGTVREIYNTADVNTALRLINLYHISYIHLGTQERDMYTELEAVGYRPDTNNQCERGEPKPNPYQNKYTCYEKFMSDAGSAKFDTMVRLGLLEVAYQNPGATVLKLTAKGRSGVLPDGTDTAPVVSTLPSNSTDPRLNRLLDAIQRNPNDFQAHYDLGQFYFQRRDYDKAAAEFETVVKLRPDEVNPYHVLGDIYTAMKQLDKALDAYKSAVDHAPQIAAAHNKYALALAERGMFTEAIAEYQATIKLDAGFIEAYFRLGQVYEGQGKKAEAVAIYQQAVLKAKPGDFWANKSTERLKVLK